MQSPAHGATTRQTHRQLWAFLLILLLVFCGRVHAQNADSTELLKQIAVDKEDTLKVKHLNELSRYFLSVNPLRTIHFATQARDLATTLGHHAGAALAHKYIGNAYNTQGNFAEALQNWTVAIDEYKAVNDKNGIANMNSNIGVIYSLQGIQDKALDFYLAALKAAEEIHDTTRIATVDLNIGVLYSDKQPDKALEYYLKALPLFRQLRDSTAIGTITVNIGESYLKKSQYDSALFYFQESRRAYEVSGIENLPYTLNDIGIIYDSLHQYDKAIAVRQDAYARAEKFDAKNDMAIVLNGLANSYLLKSETRTALALFHKAEGLAGAMTSRDQLKISYAGLSDCYSRLKDYEKAFQYQRMLTSIKDTLYNIDIDRKLGTQLFNLDIEKKSARIRDLNKEKEIQDLDLQRQKLAKNAFLVGLVLIFIIAFIIYRSYRQKVKTNAILDKQKDEIEGLLLNILPAEVAQQLQRDGFSEPRHYDSVSVLFTDFKGFTTIASGLTPDELVRELNGFFSAFDDIMGRHNVEKIKTIGDAYMCAGGLPTPNTTHPLDIVKAGLEIQDYMTHINVERTAKGLQTWNLRVGIHTGPVVAGVVGKKKYAYDIWGSTVNIASRLESNGEAGRVNISAETYELIREHFSCEYRGKIYAKNVGEIDMYFVDIPAPAETQSETLTTSNSENLPI